MNLSSAVEVAENEDVVRSLQDKGWFLFSVMTELSPDSDITFWKLDFYNPNKGKTRTVTVSKTGASVGEDDDLVGEAEEFFPDEALVKPKKALETARREVKTPLQKIIITNKKNLYWNIVFITRVATMVLCHVDMRSGKILLKKESSLFSMLGKDPSKH